MKRILFLLSVVSIMAQASVWDEPQVTRLGVVKDVEIKGEEIRVKILMQDQLGNVKSADAKICDDTNHQYQTDEMRALHFKAKLDRLNDLKKEQSLAQVTVRGPWNECLNL